MMHGNMNIKFNRQCLSLSFSLSIIYFFKDTQQAPFPFSGKKAPILMYPSHWAILNHCTPQAQ